MHTQLSEEEKQVYDYTVQKLAQGNDKVAKAARESAFIYARMAECWTEIIAAEIHDSRIKKVYRYLARNSCWYGAALWFGDKIKKEYV